MKPIILTGVGADVELFLQDRKTKEIVSAEGYIMGTKEMPYIFDVERPHFATSLDNVLAEFGIPPATNKTEFYNYLKKSVNYIESVIPKELCTAVLPSAVLDPKYLQTKQAKTFGCEPDFNAYTMNTNNRPFCRNKQLRSGGGHIHLGYNDPLYFDPEDYYSPDIERANIVKVLDLFIGVPSQILEPDNERKALYGKAGAFRPKRYGLEYRTISNFYLESKKLVYFIYDQVMKAIDWINNNPMIEDTIQDFSQMVNDVINTNNKQGALQIIEQYNLMPKRMLTKALINS